MLEKTKLSYLYHDGRGTLERQRGSLAGHGELGRYMEDKLALAGDVEVCGHDGRVLRHLLLQLFQ